MSATLSINSFQNVMDVQDSLYRECISYNGNRSAHFDLFYPEIASLSA